MTLNSINTSVNNQKNVLNHLNDFFIQIDYYDKKGIKKQKDRVPLKYILNTKLINTKNIL